MCKDTLPWRCRVSWFLLAEECVTMNTDQKRPLTCAC